MANHGGVVLKAYLAATVADVRLFTTRAGAPANVFDGGPDDDTQPVSNRLEKMEAARQLRSELRNVPRFPEATSRSEIETVVEHQLGPWRNARFN